MKELELVREFHLKYGIPIVESHNKVPKERIRLRIDLINEEVKELVEAHKADKIQEIAKESCDVLYVVLGCALEFGYQHYFEDWVLCDMPLANDGKEHSLLRVHNHAENFAKNWAARNLTSILYDLEEYTLFVGFNLQQCFEEVHQSNMSKGTNWIPVFREDGKLLKGEDFAPANLSFLN